MEYDNVYPPLHKPLNDGSNNQKPQKTAMQQALDSVKDKRHVIIPYDQRKYIDLTKDFIAELKVICERFKIYAKYNVTSTGSLVLNIKPIDPKIEISEHVRMMLKDAMSKPVSNYVSLTPNQSKFLIEHRLTDNFLRQFKSNLKIDALSQRVQIIAGPTSSKNIEKQLEEYLIWNCDSITSSIDVPHGFHHLISGPDGTVINRLLESIGKYVKIEFSIDNPNIIIIKGIPRLVENAKRSISQFYDKLRQENSYACFRMCDAVFASFQTSSVMDLFRSRGILLKTHYDKYNNHVISYVGDKDSADLVSEQIKIFQRSNFEIYIECPYWVCLFFKVFKQSDPDFSNKIKGSLIEVESSKKRLLIICEESQSKNIYNIVTKIIEDIVKNAFHSFEIIEEPTYKLLIANDLSRIKQIESSYCVNLFIEENIKGIPNDEDEIHLPFRLLTIIGVESAVNSAIKEIKQMKQFIDSFVESTYVIPNHLHRYLIGPKGSVLKETIKNHGPNCTVIFGKSTLPRDDCLIKGPPAEVNSIILALSVSVDKLVQQHHRIVIDIPEKVQTLLINELNSVKNVFDKFGKLDSFYIPSISSSDKFIEIIGPKIVTQSCSKYILNRIEELAISVTKSIIIPDKLNSNFAHFSKSIITYINEMVDSGITILLPSEIECGKFVSITGLSKHIDGATTMLKKLMSNDSSDCCFDFVEFSKSHSNQIVSVLSSIKTSNDLKTYLVHSKGKERSSILFIGKKAEIASVKKNLEVEICRLDHTITKIISMKAEYKRDFLKKNSEQKTMVQELSAMFNNTHIIIGDRNQSTGTVDIRLSGLDEDVAKLIEEIKKRVSFFDTRISKSAEFTVSDLSRIIDSTNFLLKNTMREYDVILSVSDNFYQQNQPKEKSMEICQVFVKGLPENVEKTINFINSEWKIASATVELSISTQKKTLVNSDLYRHLTNFYRLSVILGSDSNPPENKVTFTGCQINIQKAIDCINDIKYKNHEVRVYVPSKYFNKLIGKRGENIKNFGSQNKVKLIIPQKDSSDDVIVIGEHDNCIAASLKLKEMVKDWDSIVTETMEVDARIKARLLGPSSEYLASFGKKHATKIWLVGTEDKNSPCRTLQITGLLQNVTVCKEEIQKEVDSIMMEMDEQFRYQPPSRNECFAFDLNNIQAVQYVNNSKVSQKQLKKQKNLANTSTPTTADSQAARH